MLRRAFFALLVALAVPAGTLGCSSNDFYRGRVEATGGASAQAYRVKDGAEKPISPRYTVNGVGVATVQSVKPYLTLDGSWSPDVSASAVKAEDGAVLVRPMEVRTAAPKAVSGPDCVPGAHGDTCSINYAPAATGEVCEPTPAVVASPLSLSGRPCGTPVYVGCSGVPGGNRPTPGGTMKVIEPGMGWPCGPLPEDPVLGALAAPPGFLVHLGGCFVDFLGCAVKPLVPESAAK